MTAALLALAMSAAPDHLRPGRDASAALAISCPQAPRIEALAGSVEDLASDGEVWRATYRPPAASVPRVALLGVVCGAEAGLLSIPLWGAGDAEVHARPFSVVEVRIGDEVFGPLRTDASGVARVPVVLPPGVEFAYQGPRAIDLHVPRTRTLHLVASQQEVAVDRARTVVLWAFAVDRKGSPLAEAPLRLAVSRGAATELQGVSPGVFRSEWTLAAGAPGEALAEATLEGEPEPARARVSLRAGAPAHIALAAERSELTAGEGPLRLRAQVQDAAGNPVGTPLRASASLGTVRVLPTGAGAHDLEVSIPGAFGGQRELQITVASGHASAQARIPLRPASPARLRIAASRARALADGRTAVKVKVRAQDRFGNEVTDVPEASSSAGRVSDVARTQAGWEATWVAPRSHDRASAVVDARTGPAAASARIDLDPAVRPLAVAFRAGFFTNFHDATGPLAGFVGSLRTDWEGAQVGAQLSLDAIGWNTTDVVATSAGSRQLRTALGILLPGLSAEWRLPLSDRATLWAQGGPVLAFASTQTRLAGVSPQLSRQTEPGVQGGAGAELALWRGRALFEVRWVSVRAFSMANLQGPLTGLCTSAGYRVELF